MQQNLIDILEGIFGVMPPGLEFLYYVISMFLLVFVFILIYKLFSILFSRFFKE